MRNSAGAFRPWVAVTLLAFALVVLAVTTLKSFYTIGLLWEPENQRVRSLELIPLENYVTANTWFAPIFDTLGNLALFLPIGMLGAVLLDGARHRIRKVTALAALFSLLIELTQFIFALGRTDIDDLLTNTLGGLAGAWLATLGGRRWHALLTVVTGLAVLVFAALVVLGPVIGDPARVTPAN